jgi:hypothetical protein
MTASRSSAILLLILSSSVALAMVLFESVARAAEETPKDMLAAQIRIQGYACDKPQRALRDAKRSGPDHEVWTLRCENATYRVSRYPDLAAKVVRLR